MNSGKIASALKTASGISSIEVVEMPLMNEPPGKKIRHIFLINVGPTAFPSSDPSDILQQCWEIAEKVGVSLATTPECSHCRFGLSIFAEPGDQSGRIFTGTIEIGEVSKGTGTAPEIRDPRSNNRQIDALLQQRRSP